MRAAIKFAILAFVGGLLIGFIPVNAASYSTETISGADDTQITISKYPVQHAQDLVIWLTSLSTPPEIAAEVARTLNTLDIAVWLVDLVDDHFLPKVTSSVALLPASDIVELITHANNTTHARIFLFSEGRGGEVVLRGANLWQQQNEKAAKIILLSPDFYLETPDPGHAAQLIPIVTNTNLPVFVIQPQLSPRYWQLTKAVSAMESQGSEVYTQVIKNVRDRFHYRSDATAVEEATARYLPRVIKRAIGLLATVAEKRHPLALKTDTVASAKEIVKKDHTLKKYTGDSIPPPLRLRNMQGTWIELADFSNKVVLVNFWTTWCPPCVLEMPSLQRLNRRLGNGNFTVLGVNMGENSTTIADFLRTKVAVDFPILRDEHGVALRDWKVYAFPTSFVIGKSGKIRYALFGSVDWDAPEFGTVLEELIREQN